METKTILIIEDHPLMRTAINAALSNLDDIVVVSEGCSVAEGKRMLMEAHPDLLLLDLYLPDGNGLQLVEFRNESTPATKILVITSASREDEILSVLKAGAEGIIGKDSSAERVRFAVREVLAGKNYLMEEGTRVLLRTFQADGSSNRTPLDSLSPRKAQVLKLLASGATNREIAQELVISESTVRSHLQQISQRLGLKNKRELVLFAAKHFSDAPRVDEA